MVKPEWGAKRTCPKCSTRFYDLGKDDTVGFMPTRPFVLDGDVIDPSVSVPIATAARLAAMAAPDPELEAEDLAVDEDAEISADEEVDLETGDDDLGVETAGEDDEV